NIFNFERKNLYYLLRHAQVPIDFVGDEDLADAAFLRRYKVLVLAARHLRRDSAQALARWVADGGRLIAVAASGLLDEYPAPLGVLDEVFGVASAAPRITETRCSAKECLAWLPPLDVLAGSPVPALAVIERTVPAGAEVRARFAGGDPAILWHRYGRG